MTKPFLKWAGGKAWAVDLVRERLPETVNLYFEPFLGGGAVALGLDIEPMVLSDLCLPLMKTWEAVRLYPGRVVEHLERLIAWYDLDHEVCYYDNREILNNLYIVLNPEISSYAAARFILLNHTGFNGLWRVNRQEACNVPWGHRGPPDGERLGEAIKEAAGRLSRAVLLCEDVITMVERAGRDDFIYLDPPYDGLYDQYVGEGFDLRILAAALRQAGHRGVNWLMQQAATVTVRKLFEGFEIEEIEGPTSISRNGGGRGARKELIIRNYTLAGRG